MQAPAYAMHSREYTNQTMFLATQASIFDCTITRKPWQTKLARHDELLVMTGVA